MTEEVPLLTFTNVAKSFTTADQTIDVLRNISFEIQPAEIIAVTGPSGSGKSTLLSLAAGLDLPSSGSIDFIGKRLDRLSEDQRAEARLNHCGFIFQNFNLLPTLTALENVGLPLELRGAPPSRAAEDLLESLGLGRRKRHYPSQLSGGEQQRVALARAFVTEPKILFADEPTGSLDRPNAAAALDLMLQLSRSRSTAVLVVTHDPDVAARANRVLDLRDGALR